MKTVVITWASSGLGKSLVTAFLQKAYTVIGIARNKEKLAELNYDLCCAHFYYEICDLNDSRQIEETFNSINERHWTVNCLINNAGIWYFENVIDETADQIIGTVQTNLIAPILCSKKVIPHMIAQNYGTIINIWSTWSTAFRVWVSAYASSKAWLKMYSDVMREELRPYNIRVLSIYPWAMATPIREDEELEQYKNQMIDPDDVAQIILDAYQSSLSSNAVQEDIFIRPITGNI